MVSGWMSARVLRELVMAGAPRLAGWRPWLDCVLDHTVHYRGLYLGSCAKGCVVPDAPATRTCTLPAATAAPNPWGPGSVRYFRAAPGLNPLCGLRWDCMCCMALACEQAVHVCCMCSAHMPAPVTACSHACPWYSTHARSNLLFERWGPAACECRGRNGPAGPLPRGGLPRACLIRLRPPPCGLPGHNSRSYRGLHARACINDLTQSRNEQHNFG